MYGKNIRHILTSYHFTMFAKGGNKSVKKGYNAKRSLNNRRDDFKNKGIDKREAYFNKKRLQERKTSTKEKALTRIDFTKFPVNWVQQLFSPQYSSMLVHLRRMTAQDTVKEDEIFGPICQSHVLQQLRNILTTTQVEQEQYEILWLLSNLTSSEDVEVYTNAIVQAQMIPALVPFIKSEEAKVVEQCLWTIANIMGEKNIDFMNQAIQCNIVDGLIYAAKTYSNIPTLISEIFRGASELCRGAEEKDLVKLIPFLCAGILQSDCEDYHESCCRGLHHISARDDEKYVQLIVQTSVVPKLLKLSVHRNPYIQKPVLDLIGVILSGSSSLTHYMINIGIIPFIKSFLEHIKEEDSDDFRLQKICWISSNLIRESKECAMTLLQAQVLPHYFELWKNTRRGTTQIELIHVFQDICCLEIPQLSKTMVEQGVLWIFYNALPHPGQTTPALHGLIAMQRTMPEAMQAIWKKENHMDSGAGKIKDLQNCEDIIERTLLSELYTLTRPQ